MDTAVTQSWIIESLFCCRVTPTALVELSEDAVILYPNPFRSMLSIDHAAGLEIVLFDMKGKILLIYNLKDNQENIDFSFLLNYMYPFKRK